MLWAASKNIIACGSNPNPIKVMVRVRAIDSSMYNVLQGVTRSLQHFVTQTKTYTKNTCIKNLVENNVCGRSGVVLEFVIEDRIIYNAIAYLFAVISTSVISLSAPLSILMQNSLPFRQLSLYKK